MYRRLQILLEKAEFGDSSALWTLAKAFLGENKGAPLGLGRSDAKAEEYHIKMWDTGDSDGQWNLGYAYGSGKFGKVDEVKALEYYTKAAEGGDAHVQYLLGYIYEDASWGWRWTR